MQVQKYFGKDMTVMAALHDETRYRWMRLPPEKFIGTVLYGALREKIKLAYTAISVYTQIIHSLPGTASVRLSNAVPARDPIKLRDLMKHMRACIADAHDIIQSDTATLSLASYTPEGYILGTVRDIRRAIQHIDRWAASMTNDPGMQVELPTLDGKRACDVAAEIQKYITDVNSLLDFAQLYAERSGQPTA